MSARPYVAFGLGAVAALELLAHFSCAARAPAMADYGAVVEPVTALREPGDLVVVAPSWAEPLVRRALGDELMPLSAVARPDDTSFSHALLVSIGDADAPELDGWVERERREAGPFIVRRLENPDAAHDLYDFVAALGPAVEVSILREHGVPSRCMWNPRSPIETGGLGGHPTWPRERFLCGAAELNVGVTVISDEGYRPRRCIWAHPPPRADLAIRFRAVPLGVRIVGHAGLDWMTERARRGAPVEMRVEIDGEPLGSLIHADGDGWAAFDMPLRAPTDRGDVSFIVSAPDVADRGFCFEARSR